MKQKNETMVLVRLEHRMDHLTDGEHGIVGFPHGVVDEDGHQVPDLVQISGPAFLGEPSKVDDDAQIRSFSYP